MAVTCTTRIVATVQREELDFTLASDVIDLAARPNARAPMGLLASAVTSRLDTALYREELRGQSKASFLFTRKAMTLSSIRIRHI